MWILIYIKHTMANNDKCEFGFLFSFGTIDKENLSRRVSDNKICSRDSEDLQKTNSPA
jgi:hypothetical protein